MKRVTHKSSQKKKKLSNKFPKSTPDETNPKTNRILPPAPIYTRDGTIEVEFEEAAP